MFDTNTTIDMIKPSLSYARLSTNENQRVRALALGSILYTNEDLPTIIDNLLIKIKNQKEKNMEVLALLNNWLNDPSDYDKVVYPEIEKSIKQQRFQLKDSKNLE